MAGDVTIRMAGPEDMERITGIENLCFEADRFSRKQLSYLISHARGWFFVAEANGEIAGYISLLAHSRRSGLRIYSIAVDPRFRSRGMAGSLMAKAVETARLNGNHCVSLEVRAGNSAAINLYRKHGFETISVLPSYYPDGEDACAMKLHL